MDFEAIKTPIELTLVMAFADPTNYVKACEEKSSREIFDMMSEYFELAGDIVEGAGGKIVKFIGDAVFAVFPGDNPVRAVNTLQKLKSEVEDFFKRQGVESVLKIKAHIGSATCGAIGTRRHKQFDVVGHDVNAAAMLPENGFALSVALQARIGG